MRVISGIYKGRIINAPKSELTRPTTDRTKETIFNILSNYICFDEINKVLDIYAGSGSLGFEFLSRGAKHIDFIEKNNQIVNNLNNNIKSLQAESLCTIHKTSATFFTSKAPIHKYDIIIADPPFFDFDIYEVKNNIFDYDYLTEGGLFIIERSIQTKHQDITNLGADPIRKIGDSLLYIFK